MEPMTRNERCIRRGVCQVISDCLLDARSSSRFAARALVSARPPLFAKATAGVEAHRIAGPASDSPSPTRDSFAVLRLAGRCVITRSH